MTLWNLGAFINHKPLAQLVSAAAAQLLIHPSAPPSDMSIEPLDVISCIYGKNSVNYVASDYATSLYQVTTEHDGTKFDAVVCGPASGSTSAPIVFPNVHDTRDSQVPGSLPNKSDALNGSDHAIEAGPDAKDERYEARTLPPRQEPRASTLSLLTETPDERVARIAYALGVANGHICGAPQMASGLKFHDISSYNSEHRSAAEKKFNLGHSFGIRHVIPSSGADFAGLHSGDVIKRINGQPVAQLFPEKIALQGASSARVEQFEDWLGKALMLGPVVIEFARHGEAMTTMLEAKASCGGTPVLYKTGEFNAWADGRRVAVTDEIVRFAESDDELAFVLAHEMSHNILSHVSKQEGKLTFLAPLGIGSKMIKRHEIEADTLGTKMLLNAGYSHEGALAFLGRAKRRMPFNLATTHPGISRRINIVTEAADNKQRVEQRALQDAILAVNKNSGPGLHRKTGKASLFGMVRDSKTRRMKRNP